MANNYLAASAAIGTAAGYQNRASRILVNGIDPGATDPGTIELIQGGASGTTVWLMKVLFGHGVQVTIPNIQFDYVKLTDASCVVEYYKAHGIA